MTGKLDGFAPDAKVDPRRHRPRRDRQDPRGPTSRSSRTAALRSRRSSTAVEARTGRPALAPGGASSIAGRRIPCLDRTTARRAGATDRLKPQFVVEELRDHTPDDTILVSGVGQHQMWACQYWRFEQPGTWINSGGLGHHGLRRAGGDRRQGRPAGPDGLGDRRRRLLPDDGPGARHRHCRAHPGQDRDPEQLLPGHGAPVAAHVLRGALLRGVPVARPAGLRAAGPRRWAASASASTSPEEVVPAIEKANEIDDRPVVIDFRTDPSEQVFPMVPPGASNDDIVRPPLAAARSPMTPGDRTGNRPRGARHHLLSVLVENKAGVLARVAGLFATRGLQHLLARGRTDRRTTASAGSRSSSTSTPHRSSRSSASSTS